MKPTALVDADLIAYRASTANQKTFDFDPDITTRMVDTEGAIKQAVSLVEEWRTAAACDHAILAFTGPDNFRKRILTSYKAGRGEKPEAHAAVVEHLMREYESYRIDGLEADDVLGILATTLPKYGDAVVVSIDKDLRTVPSMLFNPSIDKAWRRIEEPEADYWWMMQTLMGDPTDGYTGIPNVGVKKAEAILKPHPSKRLGDMWGAVVSAYRKHGLTEEDAIVQARVARILRREDYDREDRTIKLWHPVCPVRVSLTPTITIPHMATTTPITPPNNGS